MPENTYQSRLIEKLEDRFPGCFVIKQDPSYMQGIPDLLILHRDRWALLEVKNSHDADHQPNQDYYVDEFNKLSFAAFIHPDNEEEVLNALQQAFQA